MEVDRRGSKLSIGCPGLDDSGFTVRLVGSGLVWFWFDLVRSLVMRVVVVVVGRGSR